MLIIKGDMPKTCRECLEIGIYERCRVMVEKAVTAVMTGHDRPDDCPLVEIPDKHGDLIDEDEFRQVFYEEMRKHRGNEPIITLINELLAKADNAPVVVEATE